MITNANVGNLSQKECDKILDGIIDGVEALERDGAEEEEEESKQRAVAADVDEEALLQAIEARVLKALREKALLQRSSNSLMLQLHQLQQQHEHEVKAKNEVIRQHEIRAKVTFFKKKQPK